MKICLVTELPRPERQSGEYGIQIARELRRDALLNVCVLADGAAEEVRAAWQRDDSASARRLLRTLRDQQPDLVWFNLAFDSFGTKRLPGLSGAALPLLTRLAGIYTHVTLHQDEGTPSSSVRAHAAARMLLMANSISILVPGHRRALLEKYRADGVVNVLAARPDLRRATASEVAPRILAFGKWGTYKRLELLIDAFLRVSRTLPEARLVIAGGNDPAVPGYLEEVAQRYRWNRQIEFTGWVAEEAIPELFRSASVLVMPYVPGPGAAEVTQLGAQYGLPMVAADVPESRKMLQDGDMSAEFFERGSAEALCQTLAHLLNDTQRRREMSEQNLRAALRLSMPQMMRAYLRAMNVTQKAEALAPLARFGRVPAWVPARSAIFRAAAPRWSTWM